MPVSEITARMEMIEMGSFNINTTVGDPVETAYFEGFASGPKARSIPARASGPRQWSKRKKCFEG